MKVLWLLVFSLSLTGGLLTRADAAAAGLMQSPRETESKGYLFENSREEILAKAKKEGSLRALLGFDAPAIKALREGFRKRYPFINTQFEEVTNEASQRFLFELKAGRGAQWDIAHVTTELQHEYTPHLEKIELRGMAEQGIIQIPPKMVSPEARNLVSLSSTLDTIAYNKRLLAADKVPKVWEDLLKPEHTDRKFLTDIRPNSIAGLVPAMGLEWVETFARKLAAQQPVWVRGHTRYLNSMAAGEYRLFVGTYYHGVMRQKRKGAQDLEVGILEPVPVRLTEIHSIVRGARHNSAAMLFLEYVAGPEGQQILWDVEPFKSSIYAPGSKTEELARGRKTSIIDWEHIPKQHSWMDRIVAAYGFPRAEKK
jgi:ABC-type Fe3+ transport system substrate-binding protein